MDLTTLSPERVQKLKKWLEQADPYTEEEIMSIPFDSSEYDWKRRRAYSAQKALKEAGLLEE